MRFTAPCPKCGVERTYKTRKSRANALRNGDVCRQCFTRPQPDLETREVIIEGVALGHTVKELAADVLRCSPKTVEYHLANVYRALGLPSGDIAGVTRHAIRQGLVRT
jgi:DNA-binding NarL/FixJ family response regulator